jgi:hypothetical protein
MATSAKVDALATQALPPRNSLMGLPIELRLNIIERIQNENQLRLDRSSATGKIIYQVWCSFFTRKEALFLTWQIFRMKRYEEGGGYNPTWYPDTVLTL